MKDQSQTPDLVQPVMQAMVDAQTKKTRFDSKMFYELANNAIDLDYYSYSEILAMYKKLSDKKWGK